MPHLVALSEKLVDVAAGRCKRLIVEMPPRHGKSELVSHWFPIWYLDLRPEHRVMLASYEAEFASHWGRRVRNGIEEHKESLTVRTTRDSAAANRWETTAGGGMFTAGVGGPFTGRGGNVLIIDDPVKNAGQANSKTYRESLWEWWRSTAYTRLEPGGAAIIVQTRWHRDDLAGRLQTEMREGGEHWDVLRLPAIAEGIDMLGRVPGEALWPARYDVEELLRTERAVGPYTWSAMYQQDPVLAGGSIFQREWWESNRYDADDLAISRAPAGRYISWDTALKDGDDNAYSACVVGELTPEYRLNIREVWREKLEFPALNTVIQASAARWNRDSKLQAVIIEDKASGVSALQTLRSSGSPQIRGLLKPFTPQGDKQHRARLASQWCANGSVRLPHPSAAVPWLLDFENELFEFPRAAYADQVDAFDQLVLYLENMLSAGFDAREAQRTEEQL